jgi:hypothetical protein
MRQREEERRRAAELERQGAKLEETRLVEMQRETQVRTAELHRRTEEAQQRLAGAIAREKQAEDLIQQ